MIDKIVNNLMFIVLILSFLTPIIIIFLIIIWILRFKNSSKRNGIEVLATIQSIERENERDKNGDILETNYIVMCKFDYEGQHEQKLLHNYKLDIVNLKPGDTLNCIYDTKRKTLTTKENIKGGNYMLLLIFLPFVLIFAIDIIPKLLIEKNIFNFSPNTISTIIKSWNIFSLVCGFLVSEYCGYRMYDKYYQEGKYIKLKGKIIDYHIRYDDDTKLYAPEILFKYNEKKERFISTRWSTSKKHINGQQIDVYYNPETNRIYEKGNNLFAIIAFICGFVVLIPLIQMLFK